MRRLRTGLIAVWLAAAGIPLATASPASAAPAGEGVAIDLPASGGGFSTEPAGPLIDVVRMVPGDSVSGIMGIRNDSAGQVALTVAIREMTGSENGCLLAELAEPAGCGPGRGGLAERLVFGLGRAASQAGPYTPTWTGTSAALAAGAALDRTLGAGATVWVRVSVSLPASVGNDVESDTFGFGLRVTLDGPGSSSSVDVDGAQASSDARYGAASAFTGVPSSVLLTAALLLILSGALLVASAALSRPRADLG